MKLFDLRDYAHSKSKLTVRDLHHEGQIPTEVKTWKVMAAHLLDFYLILGVTAGLYNIFNVLLSSQMPTTKTASLILYIDSSSFSLRILPLVMTSYFFFSYFFNHGQSWGMKLMKLRVEKPTFNFRASLYWAFYSNLVVLTCGLFHIFAKNHLEKILAGNFRIEDYLQKRLMEDKVIYPINLMEKTLPTLTHKEEYEDIKKAA